jgi:long-chain acyl-CoA synthetase
MNLIELINASAERWPDKPALIDGDAEVSYAALAESVRKLAGQLPALGVKPGSRVGVSYPNSVWYVALTFALWSVEAVAVPIPTECAEEEISDMVAALGLAAIISHQPRGRAVPLPQGGFFELLPTVPAADNHGLNIAFIRFTSGTTNARKGVVLCHETVRDRIAAANKVLLIGPEDTIVWCLPMAHHFLVTIVLYLSQGATIALVHSALARSILETTRRVRGTILYAAPMHFAWLARDDSELDLATVRLAVSTTCALTQDVAEDFSNRFQRPLVQALGIIELGLICANLDDPVRRWDSVGKPLPDYRLRILDAGSDGSGDLTVSGPGIFDAYAHPWISRREVMPDGWFRTGDIARIDDDGFVFLLGRTTAVINMAGRKVFPEEIEAVLNRHPAVRESRVYGRAHPHLGELIAAEVVPARPETDAEELRDFCRQHLTAFKVPTEIHLVTAVARTAATGKILRRCERS